jgi:hypothetical protein
LLSSISHECDHDRKKSEPTEEKAQEIYKKWKQRLQQMSGVHKKSKDQKALDRMREITGANAWKNRDNVNYEKPTAADVYKFTSDFSLAFAKVAERRLTDAKWETSGTDSPYVREKVARVFELVPAKLFDFWQQERRAKKRANASWTEGDESFADVAAVFHEFAAQLEDAERRETVHRTEINALEIEKKYQALQKTHGDLKKKQQQPPPPGQGGDKTKDARSELETNKICAFHAGGSCLKGKDCERKHEKLENLTEKQQRVVLECFTPDDAERAKKRQSEGLCRDFTNLGWCKRGYQCHFVHKRRERKEKQPEKKEDEGEGDGTECDAIDVLDHTMGMFGTSLDKDDCAMTEVEPEPRKGSKCHDIVILLAQIALVFLAFSLGGRVPPVLGGYVEANMISTQKGVLVQVDNACGAFVTPFREDLVKIEGEGGLNFIVGGTACQAKGVAVLTITSKKGKRKRMVFPALYLEGARRRMWSSLRAEEDYNVHDCATMGFLVCQDDGEIFPTEKIDGRYLLRVEIEQLSPAEVLALEPDLEKLKKQRVVDDFVLHARFAHRASFPPGFSAKYNCSVCKHAKIEHRRGLQFEPPRLTLPSRRNEVLLLDGFGPRTPSKVGSHRHFYLGKCAYTGRMVGVPRQGKKDGCVAVLEAWIAECGKPRAVYADEEFRAGLKGKGAELGIVLLPSRPYDHRSRMGIESGIKQVQRDTRALLYEAGLSAEWWPWAALYSCYLSLYTTPGCWRSWFDSEPPTDKLRVFGCKAVGLPSLQKAEDRAYSKSVSGQFLGMNFGKKQFILLTEDGEVREFPTMHFLEEVHTGAGSIPLQVDKFDALSEALKVKDDSEDAERAESEAMRQEDFLSQDREARDKAQAQGPAEANAAEEQQNDNAPDTENKETQKVEHKKKVRFAETDDEKGQAEQDTKAEEDPEAKILGIVARDLARNGYAEAVDGSKPGECCNMEDITREGGGSVWESAIEDELQKHLKHAAFAPVTADEVEQYKQKGGVVARSKIYGKVKRSLTTGGGKRKARFVIQGFSEAVDPEAATLQEVHGAVWKNVLTLLALLSWCIGVELETVGKALTDCRLDDVVSAFLKSPYITPSSDEPQQLFHVPMLWLAKLGESFKIGMGKVVTAINGTRYGPFSFAKYKRAKLKTVGMLENVVDASVYQSEKSWSEARSAAFGSTAGSGRAADDQSVSCPKTALPSACTVTHCDDFWSLGREEQLEELRSKIHSVLEVEAAERIEVSPNVFKLDIYGIVTYVDRSTGFIVISQCEYLAKCIRQVLTEAGDENAPTVPVSEKVKKALDTALAEAEERGAPEKPKQDTKKKGKGKGKKPKPKTQEEKDKHMVNVLSGSINHALKTRWDLISAVRFVLSRPDHATKEHTVAALKHVLAYCRTPRVLLFRPQQTDRDEPTVDVESDASWRFPAVSGTVTRVGGNPVSATSQKQVKQKPKEEPEEGSDAGRLSSCEAELVAAVDASKSGQEVRNFLQSLGYPVFGIVRQGLDALSAYKCLRSGNSNKRLKHLELRYQFLLSDSREQSEMSWRPREENKAADSLSKVITSPSEHAAACEDLQIKELRLEGAKMRLR